MDIFAGDDLRECYNYDMGSVKSNDDIGKFISVSFISMFYDPYLVLCYLKNCTYFSIIILGMTIYHSLTDGGKFDWIEVTKYILLNLQITFHILF